MTTNSDCVIAVLAAHREARRWDDASVAADLLAQLDLKPDGEAANAKPVVDPGISEDEVKAHEEAARQATDKAKAAREALEAQKNDGKPKADNLPATQADPSEVARVADAQRLGMAPSSTRAQIDAEEAKRHASPTPSFVPPGQQDQQEVHPQAPSTAGPLTSNQLQNVHRE